MKSFKEYYPSKNEPKPTYVALSLIKIPKKGWCVVRLKMRGGQVVQDELTEPTSRSIAIEQYKILSTKEILYRDG